MRRSHDRVQVGPARTSRSSSPTTPKRSERQLRPRHLPGVVSEGEAPFDQWAPADALIAARAGYNCRMPKLLLALALALVATATEAVEVRFPLTVDYEILRGALRKHLHESGGELVLWRSPDGCRTFVMREPTVTPAGGRLKIAGPGSARAGLGLLGYCWAQVGWDGHVEVLARPEIGRDWQVRLRDLDTQLYEADRQRSSVAGRIWDAVKGWAEAELGAFTFDLGPPVEELRGLLGLFAGADRTGPLATALQTVRPVGLAVEPEAVKVMLAVDVPPAPATPRAPEPALTAAQLKRWQALLESWDGFLVFVIKDLGLAEGDPAARQELLDLLLGARHDLVAVLGRGPEPGVPDPVRPLFLGAWDRLRAIIRRTAARTGDQSRAFRYATFLAAGDALAALEAAAPSAGLEISADGLRRLARVLDPAYSGDPLEYSELPDPGLRQIFRFRDPDAPPRPPRRRPPGGGWQWLTPRAANAADDEWSLLARRLDRWVPADRELAAYRNTVARLLTLAAERSLDPDALDERFDVLFQHLVKAVAWQESCWRQFVRKGDGVGYLLSSTGDVGVMQINVRIWRGFFSPEKLRWNAAYNAGAGAEILVHLLARYGVREARERLENAARATYSAYNGGPARYRRWRTERAAAGARTVDRAFWEKYQAVAAGQADHRVLCVPAAALTSGPAS